jgi:HD-GYP domain-containing protein (c-di-GMP phosphodiesterase class II)
LKRIAIYNAKPEMILAKEIYSRNGRLLLRQGEKLSQQWIDKLMDFDVPTIYIDVDTGSKYPEITKIITSEKEKVYHDDVPDMISTEVRGEAERVVQELMHEIKAGRLIKTDKARKVVETIVSQLITNQHIVGKLADIRILDDYTFAHSVNVCILSISTGIIMGYSKVRLRELGIGALMHDVGKMKVPDEILNKKGPLTEKEFEVIKKHTIWGYEILSEHPDMTSSAARISLQHHECYNGLGYPWGIKNDEIHEYSKIVAIVDVYDALTADRVYKNAILPYEAMEIIIASTGYQFEPQIVKTFVENSEIYPVGSIVELNNGIITMVINANRALPTRPITKIVIDAQGNEVNDGEVIDLMKNPTLFISKIVRFRRKTGL